ncbi:MAG: SCO family protein [Proteobacteria bacterium]|nr:MAG: SCO family protein [Pseudomonadota bacterium]
MTFPAKGTAILLVAWVIVIGGALALFSPRPEPPDDALLGVLRPSPTPLRAFELTDQTGSRFDVERLKGYWTLLFFGYTYCPDICPATLSTLSAVARELESTGWTRDDYQVVFVSIDPARDDLEHIARYLAFFDDGYTGVTGDPDALLSFATQFGARYYREPADESDATYFMAHTSSIFLVNPRAELVASFSPPHDGTTIATLLRRIVEWM